MISDVHWELSTNLSADRADALRAVSSFNEIIKRIISEGKIVRADIKSACDRSLVGCLRPEFEIEVSAATADAFFNSAVGYRAQYLRCPDEGQKQNNRLLRAVESMLLSSVPADLEQKMSKDHIRLSLAGCSAKVWLSEGKMTFGRDLVEDICVPQWSTHAYAAVAAYARGGCPSPPEQEKAIWALRAPKDTILDVKGGYLDGSFNEAVPNNKIRRRDEIHRYGFS